MSLSGKGSAMDESVIPKSCSDCPALGYWEEEESTCSHTYAPQQTRTNPNLHKHTEDRAPHCPYTWALMVCGQFEEKEGE